MSIILDALKKAEGNGKQDEVPPAHATSAQASPPHPAPEAAAVPAAKGTGMFNPASRPMMSGRGSGGGSGSGSKRVIILASVAVLALGAFMFLKYFKSARTDVVATIPIKVFKPAPQNISVNPDGTVKSEMGDEDAAKAQPSPLELERIAELKSAAASKFLESPPKYKEAANDYQELLKITQADAEVYNNYGVVLKKLGKKKEAEEAYLDALDLRPDYPEALNNLAVLYISNSDYRKAKDRLEKAIELDSDYPDPYLHLALCLEKIGQRELAIGTYETFLEMSHGKFDRNIRLQVESRIARLKEL